jgi:hypothetical protein
MVRLCWRFSIRWRVPCVRPILREKARTVEPILLSGKIITNYYRLSIYEYIPNNNDLLLHSFDEYWRHVNLSE